MAVALSDVKTKSDNAETPTKDETEQDSAREYKTVRRYYALWLSSDFFISKPSDFLFDVQSLARASRCWAKRQDSGRITSWSR
jgi:hypothetical protein